MHIMPYIDQTGARRNALCRQSASTRPSGLVRLAVAFAVIAALAGLLDFLSAGRRGTDDPVLAHSGEAP